MAPLSLAVLLPAAFSIPSRSLRRSSFGAAWRRAVCSVAVLRLLPSRPSINREGLPNLKSYPTLEAFEASADKATTIPTDYVRALFGLTRRPITIADNAAIGHFTQFRSLELSNTDEDTVAAWTVGCILICGEEV